MWWKRRWQCRISVHVKEWVSDWLSNVFPMPICEHMSNWISNQGIFSELTRCQSFICAPVVSLICIQFCQLSWYFPLDFHFQLMSLILLCGENCFASWNFLLVIWMCAFAMCIVHIIGMHWCGIDSRDVTCHAPPLL